MKVTYNKRKQSQDSQDLFERFPHDGILTSGEESKVNPDNHFKELSIDDVRQKYIKFTVFMEALYEVLDLKREATMEEFAFRVRDIVYAANDTNNVE